MRKLVDTSKKMAQQVEGALDGFGSPSMTESEVMGKDDNTVIAQPNDCCLYQQAGVDEIAINTVNNSRNPFFFLQAPTMSVNCAIHNKTIQ